MTEALSESREHKKYRIAAARDIQNRPTQLRCEIECPFCGATTIAYVWSLSGGGKKCGGGGCSAVHTSYGITVKKQVVNCGLR